MFLYTDQKKIALGHNSAIILYPVQNHSIAKNAIYINLRVKLLIQKFKK